MHSNVLYLKTPEAPIKALIQQFIVLVIQTAVFYKKIYYTSQFTTTWWLSSFIAFNFKTHPDFKNIKI